MVYPEKLCHALADDIAEFCCTGSGSGSGSYEKPSSHMIISSQEVSETTVDRNKIEARYNWKRLTRGAELIRSYKQKKAAVGELFNERVVELKKEAVQSCSRRPPGNEEEDAKRRCQEKPSSSKGHRCKEESRGYEESVCKSCQIFYGCREGAEMGQAICFKCLKEAREKQVQPRTEASLGQRIRAVRVLSINSKGMQVLTSGMPQEIKPKSFTERIKEQHEFQTEMLQEFMLLAEGQTKIRILKYQERLEIEKMLEKAVGSKLPKNCPSWEAWGQTWGSELVKAMSKIDNERKQEEMEAEEREQDNNWMTAKEWKEAGEWKGQRWENENIVLIMVIRIGGGFNLYGSGS